MSETGALAGVVVLELAEGWSATALCGRHLADLGAEVIKVEPVRGDRLRRREPLHESGDSYAFQFAAAGKRSVALDLGTAGGARALAYLIRGCDVVLDGTARGIDRDPLVAEAGRPAIRAALEGDPELVWASVSFFGRRGALAEWHGSELVVQALAGTIATTGFGDRPGVKAGPALITHGASLLAASSILAALLDRETTGLGQQIDLALHDVAVAYLGIYLPGFFTTGTEVPRQGNRHTQVGPWNVFPTSDGEVLICAASDTQWEQLLRLFGREDLIAEERYVGNANRVKYLDEVDAIVSAWSRTQPTAAVIEAVESIGVPAGPVTSVPQVLENPQFRARELLVESPGPSGTPMPTLGTLFKLEQTPGQVRWGAPRLGEDAEVVLRDVAGYEPVQIRTLRRDGALAGESGAPSRPGVRRPEASSPQTRAAAAERRGALAGLRVVELTQYTAGPFCGRVLANLGADVIKVEPGKGESTRSYAHGAGGTSYFFHLNNAGKRSVTIDTSREEGKQLLRDLVAVSDVLLENFAPGTMERQGIGYRQLKEINPKLVYCSVNGFGLGGPWSSKRAFDTVIQALGGIMSLTGERDGEPVKIGVSAVDLLGASLATVPVLAALYHRARTGEGQFIDVAMYDAAAWLCAELWPLALAGELPLRDGNRHLLEAPQNVYEAQDGPVAVAVDTNEQWRALVGLLSLEDGPELTTAAGRRRRAGELDGRIAAWVRSRTAADVVAALQGAGVPAAPVLNVAGIVALPQVADRELILTRPHPGGETVYLTGTPFKLSRTPGYVAGPGPVLGAATDEVLRDVLGRSPEAIAALRAAKVV